jgi:hypothetical protein
MANEFLRRRYNESVGKSLTELTQAGLTRKYAHRGHPSIEELMAAQGVTFPRDLRDFLGDFWPEEESTDDFLAALHEWRGHVKTDPAA